MGLFKPKTIVEKEEQDSRGDRNVVAYEEPEQIWVEGFKGTQSNLKCQNLQYELNKEYTITGDPIECEKGFHFCKELEHVFRHYAYDFRNRFFKVKALVNKNSWEKHSDKYVAKSIILTEEIDLTYEELMKMGQLSSRSIYHEYLYTYMPKDLFEAKKADPLKNTELQWYIGKMSEIGHSETFAFILIENTYSEWSSYVEVYNRAKALYDEGISKDMKAVLMMRYQKEAEEKMQKYYEQTFKHRFY